MKDDGRKKKRCKTQQYYWENLKNNGSSILKKRKPLKVKKYTNTHISGFNENRLKFVVNFIKVLEKLASIFNIEHNDG